jgi:Tol biopolymer transport system component
MILKSKIMIFFCIVIMAISIIGFINKPSGPNEEARLQPLPSSAEILFVSNMGTGDRTKEIYSMGANGDDITRITFTGNHHRILGIDRTKKYIVVTRIDEDTNSPSGLGDEDRKSLWILDFETGEENQLTNPNNDAEGDSFSPDDEWIVFYMVLSGDTQSDIYKIRRDGTDLTRLTYTEDASESDPSWSNDGD